MFSKKVCKINTNFLTAKLFFKNIQELFFTQKPSTSHSKTTRFLSSSNFKNELISEKGCKDNTCFLTTKFFLKKNELFFFLP